MVRFCAGFRGFGLGSGLRFGALGVVVASMVAGCTPLVRDADFVGAPDQVTEATLLGPFDGQVLDANTGEPIAGATIVGVWTYDDGRGLSGPGGSHTVRTTTDAAGRYHIGTPSDADPPARARLLDFQLFVYKRGYVGYRSDTTFEGRSRSDFAMRHHRVELRKWRESDSHAQHLLFLDGPPLIAKNARWERSAANADLYRRLTGSATRTEAEGEGEPTPTPALQLLEASALLTPEEVRRRTGSGDVFTVKELGDLARTHFYHGVHLQAVDKEEAWDVAYRVWQRPPGGLETVVETLEATLPDVEPQPLITEETWVYDSEDIRAVAFIDREADVGVLLTCGAKQCVDIETTIILAKFIHDGLDRLKTVDAPSTPAADTNAEQAPAQETTP